MKLQVNKMAYPVTTLGPGRRMALWVQGCSRECPGCASTDMWDYAGGVAIEVEELAAQIADAVVAERLEGLSISGGEPAEQAEGLAELVQMARERIASRRDGVEMPFDVLVFSGYTRAEIEGRFGALARSVDAMVCGPYDQARPRANRLVATDNQELVIVNENVRDRFDAYVQGPERALQFDVEGDAVSMVGMPDAGDLELFAKKLAERGVILGDASWRR